MNKTVLSEISEMAYIMKEAARIEIMPRFGNVKEEEKYTHGRESVTAADREGSKYILERRRLVHPGSFSEEDVDDTRFLYDMVEEYDPVDGTDEFIAGSLEGFAMHGALLSRSYGEKTYNSVGGIIYLPGTDLLWYSDGVEIRREFMGKPDITYSQDARTLRGWVRNLDIITNLKLYDNDKRPVPLVHYMESQYRIIGKHLGLDTHIVPGGGSGASFVDLLEGKTNLILLPWDDSKEWDLAMAEPIIHARGGFICDFAGREYHYNRKNVLNKTGYVSSILFKKTDILPCLSPEMVLTKYP